MKRATLTNKPCHKAVCKQTTKLQIGYIIYLDTWIFNIDFLLNENQQNNAYGGNWVNNYLHTGRVMIKQDNVYAKTKWQIGCKDFP